MSETTQPTTLNLRWPWIIAAGVVTLIIVCASVAVLLWLESSADLITPAQEQTASAALQNPASAAIDLDQYGYTGWYPANGTDYAVENGMVIFPQPPGGNPLKQWYSTVNPDKTMPALVFAPGVQSLPRNATAPYPAGQSWAYIGEWFLFRCAPIPAHPGWWNCMLLVGGNL